MRISSEHVARLLEARLERLQQAGATKPSAQPEAPRPDVVSFSARADDIRAALRAAESSETADRAQLNALAKSVKEGGYRVPARQVVEAMLRELRI